MDSQQGFITTVVIQDTRSNRRYEIKEIFFCVEHLNARRDRHYLDDKYHMYLQPSTINVRRLSPTKSIQSKPQHTKIWPDDASMSFRAAIKQEMESAAVDYKSAFSAENSTKTFRIIFSNLPSCQSALHPHAQRRPTGAGRPCPRKQLARQIPRQPVAPSRDSTTTGGLARDGGPPRLYRAC
ncbi:hypothetical protein RUND412_000516 [Rhizina undulata]